MKVLVIGGVAAGTKTAAKLKRLDPEAEVKILTKGKDISYAGCGLPYYVGNVIEESSELLVNTPESFAGLTRSEVVNNCEVLSVDPEKKTVKAILDNREFEESYDKLVIATGASPLVPSVEGTKLPGVFVMRTVDDAVAVRDYMKLHNCRSAVVAGAGFIGLEIAENLDAQGLQVSIIDLADQVLPNVLDKDMADYVSRHLKKKGIRVLTGTPLEKILGEDKAEGVLAGGNEVAGDVVVLALGIKPATAFLEGSGIELEQGAVVVNEKMETSVPDIYAAGDCVIVKNRLTGKPQKAPMGSVANITGRMAAMNICGGNAVYPGTLGTAVVKLSDSLNAGRTGLSEEAAKACGYEAVSAVSVAEDKPHYYPGSENVITKVVADKTTHQLLGVQVLSAGPIDKMIDIAALGISAGLKLEDFDAVDFAYAPPFSTAIHPFTSAVYVLENKISGVLDSMTPAEYMAGAAKGYEIVDVSSTPSIPGAKFVDLTKLTGPIDGLDLDAKILLVCTRGRRAYFAFNRMKGFGYTNVRMLEGGLTVNYVKLNLSGKIPADEVKRLKGLGCLQDKTTWEHFNVRVITRNGKVTNEDYRVIGEAAAKYGSGEVAMTTRLTMEIQHVHYNVVDEMIGFLNDHGVLTGGTGSLVRPVVSCKGTTCQYGLIDTFGLSEKLHNEFYLKWHTVTLPHKFKIAVGGCPNNCVKPDLNDLGIIGQRVPVINKDKCRGCKVCQVENACPIKVAQLADGTISIDEKACNHCGRCLGKCPFNALEEGMTGYRIAIGGRWGKRVAMGKPLGRILTSEEEVMEVVEKAILLFRNEGITGERFSDTIERLGFEYVENKLLNEKLDKDEILQKTVKGGATC